MLGEQLPGHHFDGLVEGSETAGEADKTIGQFEHPLLARVHAVDGDHRGHTRMGDLGAFEKTRDYAGDTAARGQCRVGNHTHQPDRAATEYQIHSALAAFAAKGAREVCVRPANTGTGAAIDANRLKCSQSSLLGNEYYRLYGSNWTVHVD